MFGEAAIVIAVMVEEFAVSLNAGVVVLPLVEIILATRLDSFDRPLEKNVLVIALDWIVLDSQLIRSLHVAYQSHLLSFSQGMLVVALRVKALHFQYLD